MFVCACVRVFLYKIINFNRLKISEPIKFNKFCFLTNQEKSDRLKCVEKGQEFHQTSTEGATTTPEKPQI